MKKNENGFEIDTNNAKELVPITVGKLKVSKPKGPLFIIFLIIIFIIFVIFLPDIVDLIRGKEQIKSESETNLKEETDVVVPGSLKCVYNNISYTYEFENVLKSVTYVSTYNKNVINYDSRLSESKENKEKYNLIDNVICTLNETEDGFTFIIKVTYPGSFNEQLNNSKFFTETSTKEEIKESMELNNYTCS